MYKTAFVQQNPVIQRLGHILDELGKVELSDCLYKLIEQSKLRKTVLSLSHEKKSGEIDDRWKILKNMEIDLPWYRDGKYKNGKNLYYGLKTLR